MAGKRVRREGRMFRLIGGIGLAAEFLLNVVVFIGTDERAGVPFSDDWWSGWFPGYAFLGIFLLVGFLGRRRIEVPDPVGSVTVKNTREPGEKENPATNPIVFDRGFKVYVERSGKERRVQLIASIADVVRTQAEAVALFEQYEDLENDARHFMHLKSLGQMDLAEVRKKLMDEHPYLSDQALEMAIEFGATLAGRS